MNATKIIAAALAALLLSAGTVAAIPGQAADAGTDNANDDADDAMQASEDAADGDDRDADDDANASEMKPNASEKKPAVAEDASERRGPPTDMPEQVPDHVVQIHETINQWLSGDFDGSLGDAINDVTPDEESAEDESVDADEESENADEESTETPEQATENAEQTDDDADSDDTDGDETTADVQPAPC